MGGGLERVWMRNNALADAVLVCLISLHAYEGQILTYASSPVALALKMRMRGYSLVAWFCVCNTICREEFREETTR
jgi:hypothetical protein